MREGWNWKDCCLSRLNAETDLSIRWDGDVRSDTPRQCDSARFRLSLLYVSVSGCGDRTRAGGRPRREQLVGAPVRAPCARRRRRLRVRGGFGVGVLDVGPPSDGGRRTQSTKRARSRSTSPIGMNFTRLRRCCVTMASPPRGGVARELGQERRDMLVRKQTHV